VRLRVLLAALIVVSTAAFVVGTTLERNNKHNESPEHVKAERAAQSKPEPTTTTTAKTTPKRAPSRTTTVANTTDEHSGESAAHRAAEGLPPETTTVTKTTAAHAAEQHRTGEPSPHVEGNGAESAAAHESEGAHSETHAELKPLGIDIEAVPFVVLAALVSVGLAIAAWLRPRWLLLLLVIVATMLAFALLDVREVFHQSDENQTGLAVLAAVIAVLHLAAASVAGLMSRAARQPLA
jgi:hypothetical protein